MPGHVFAVDPRRLRYGWFVPQDGRLEFREYHVEEVAARLFQAGPMGGPARDVEQLEALLTSLLSRVSQPPLEASLVLPDSWLRVVASDLEDLPRRADREAVLRFKLKRLVPFRVEDLRLDAIEVPALDSARQDRRLLLGFGVEALLEQLENVFGRQGIEIGQISSESLALLALLEPLLSSGSLGIVVHVTPLSYSVVVTRSGQPVMHRFKGIGGGMQLRAELVPKDLRLTRTFLARSLKGGRIGEVVLVAPEGEAPVWKEWLESVFEHPVRSLAEEWPTLPGTVTEVSSTDAAPLLGAASREID